MLWSHSLALITALPVCSSPTLILVHGIDFPPSPQRFYKFILVHLGDGLYQLGTHILPPSHPLQMKIEGYIFGATKSLSGWVLGLSQLCTDVASFYHW